MSAFMAIAIPVLIAWALWDWLYNGKKTTFIPIHFLMKKTTTRNGHVFSVTVPKKSKRKKRGKR